MTCLVALTALHAQGAIIQTNFATGDGSIPGGAFVHEGNLLSSNLVLASRSGTFYREDSNYIVNLTRLGDGNLGPAGSSGLGSDGSYTVMPNMAVLQFDFDRAYDLATIRSYASWDSGRSGQSYTIKYATAGDPLNFITLFSLTPFNTATSTFPDVIDIDWETEEEIIRKDESLSSTMVQLTSSNGALMSNVISLQFVFNGYQNGGTAYREFQVTAVPEPSHAAMSVLACCFGLARRRR